MLWSITLLSSPGPLRDAWLAFSRSGHLTKSQVEAADVEGAALGLGSWLAAAARRQRALCATAPARRQLLQRRLAAIASPLSIRLADPKPYQCTTSIKGGAEALLELLPRDPTGAAR